MSLFTLKYAPKNEKQLFGQDLAVSQLKNFIVNYKTQKHKAALLVGPIGTGKTASVYALAKQLEYDILELNSSDLRNADAIKKFLGSALGQQSLFFTPKIVLIDEVDNISGVKDRGCIPALVKAIQASSFPVILTANSIEDSKLKALKKACQIIEFSQLDYKSVAHCCAWILEQEEIKFEEKAINSLARQADGDMRAALIDLQTIVAQGEIEFERVTQLGSRKRTETIMNALRIIFKSSTVATALPALNDVDLDIGKVFLWIDYNMPKEYLDATSLSKAYEWISRADVFHGRIRKRQHWRFLAYINNLLTAGVSSAKKERNSKPVEYKQTMRLLRIWQANMKFAKRKEIAKKLAVATHTSTKVATAQIPYLQTIFSKGAGAAIADELELSEDEVGWLGK